MCPSYSDDAFIPYLGAQNMIPRYKFEPMHVGSLWSVKPVANIRTCLQSTKEGSG